MTEETTIVQSVIDDLLDHTLSNYDDEYIDVQINTIESNPYQINNTPVNASLATRNIPLIQRNAGVDIDATGLINGINTLDYDLNQIKDDDKPWRKPGADITDYFNYGFNEETWTLYCLKQRRLRSENVQLSTTFPKTPMLPANFMMAQMFKPNSMPSTKINPNTLNGLRRGQTNIDVIGATDETSRRIASSAELCNSTPSQQQTLDGQSMQIPQHLAAALAAVRFQDSQQRPEDSDTVWEHPNAPRDDSYRRRSNRSTSRNRYKSYGRRRRSPVRRRDSPGYSRYRSRRRPYSPTNSRHSSAKRSIEGESSSRRRSRRHHSRSSSQQRKRANRTSQSPSRRRTRQKVSRSRSNSRRKEETSKRDK